MQVIQSCYFALSTAQTYKEIEDFAQPVSLYIKDNVSMYLLRLNCMQCFMFVVITTHFHFSLILIFLRYVSCVYLSGREMNTVYLMLTLDVQILNFFLQNACIFPVGDQITLYMREWFQRLMNVILLKEEQQGLAFVRVNFKRPYYLNSVL